MSLLQRGCFCLAAVTVIGAGGSGGCHQSPPDGSSRLEVSVPTQLSNQHVRDTLYLSDYGEKIAYDDAQTGVVVQLPQALVLRNCQFDRPVYAGRSNETVIGGYLDMSQSTFGDLLDLSRLRLNHHLGLAALTATAAVDLAQVSVEGKVDLSHARLAADLSLANAQVGSLQGRRLVVGGSVNAQRLRVVHELSLIEAEVQGYFDLSYLRCHGDSYFDLCKNADRVMLDHGDYYGRVNFAQVQWPSVSMRFVRARAAVESLPNMAAAQREGLRQDLMLYPDYNPKQ